jgi:hypothetical protein
MSTEQITKDERARSIVKLTEIEARVNNNREATYLYVAARKDVLGTLCVKELEFFAKGKPYLEWLYLHGHLTRVKRTTGGTRQYVYNAAIPYVKPAYDNPNTNPTEDQKIIKSVTRVIKLLDREQEVTTKAQRDKARRTNTNRMSGMQSSMNMFGSW